MKVIINPVPVAILVIGIILCFSPAWPLGAALVTLCVLGQLEII